MYRGLQVGCHKFATRIRACAEFSIQNSHQKLRMREFSSQICDNQPANLCNQCRHHITLARACARIIPVLYCLHASGSCRQPAEVTSYCSSSGQLARLSMAQECCEYLLFTQLSYTPQDFWGKLNILGPLGWQAESQCCL